MLRLTRSRRDALAAAREELECGYSYQNQRRLPYYQPRPTCPEGDLCKDCEYALHLMIWPLADDELREGEQDGCVGWLDRMIATEFCPFCQFLVKIFFNGCPGFPRTEVVCESNRRRFCCWLGGLRAERVLEGSSSRDDQLSWHGIVSFQEVSDFDLPTGGSTPYKPRSLLGFGLDVSCKDAAVSLYGPHTEDGALLNLTRRVAPLWDAELFREAMRSCESRHDSKCQSPRTALTRFQIGESKVIPQIASLLRAVDVHKMCITSLPPDARYVALSYCWSREPYLTTTTHNLTLLKEEGSLNSQNLAPTIEDAIKATRELGLGYVWIDALCIVQDDAADKARQLVQMDNVYRMAAVTIVAAASFDNMNDGGLPGITRPREKIDQVKVRGLEFQQLPVSVWDYLESSRWQTRAWTFQEYLLSKRLLVFKSQEAHFYCSRSNYAESTIDHVCMDARKVNARALVPCCDLTITELDRDGNGLDGPKNYNNTYESLVQSYTRRQMSFQMDALNACRGLIDLLSGEHDVSFLCGLPITHLVGRYLHWCPDKSEEGSVRREPADSAIAFPSWSWCGWVGTAMYPTLSWPAGFNDVEFAERGIELVLASEVTDWQLVLPTEDGRRVTPNEQDKSLLDIQTCQLSFTTNVTNHFQLSEELWGSLFDFTEHNTNSTCYQVIIDEKHAGSLLLHQEYRDSHSLVSQDDVELIELSRAEDRWMMWYPLVEGDLRHEDNHRYDDEQNDCVVDRPPFDETELDLFGLIVNVLLVEWRDGAAHRIGVGQIHEAAWELTCPTKKEILLC